MLSRLLTLAACLSPTVSAKCWRGTACSGPAAASFEGPWNENIFAPASRRISPKSILSLPNGEFVSDYLGGKALEGNNSAWVFDFGVEVGGVIHVNYTMSGSPATLGLSFTESKLWIGQRSDNSNGAAGPDLALHHEVQATGQGTYVVPDNKQRGGFRYLTLFLLGNSTSRLDIGDVELEISFQPTWPDLRAYQCYFHSDDELLNKIWYAGAYTPQTNCIPSDTGRHATNLPNGWDNGEIAGVGDTILVDGAKRDRWIWPGDMGIAVPSSFVNTGDMQSVKNALETIYNYQVSRAVSAPLPGVSPTFCYGRTPDMIESLPAASCLMQVLHGLAAAPIVSAVPCEPATFPTRRSGALSRLIEGN